MTEALQIRWKCECGKSLTAAPDRAGFSCRCPKCGATGRVPSFAGDSPSLQPPPPPPIGAGARDSSSFIEVPTERLALAAKGYEAGDSNFEEDYDVPEAEPIDAPHEPRARPAAVPLPAATAAPADDSAPPSGRLVGICRVAGWILAVLTLLAVGGLTAWAAILRDSMTVIAAVGAAVGGVFASLACFVAAELVRRFEQSVSESRRTNQLLEEFLWKLHPEDD